VQPIRRAAKRRVRAAWLPLLVGLGLYARLGEAQPADERPSLPLRLTVESPAGCPSGPEFFAQVRAHTARIREAAPGEPARTVRVELEPSGGQFLGRLSIRETNGEEGRREIRDVGCESVAAGLAFVVAVIMDPEAARTASPSAIPPPSLARPPSSPPLRLSAGAAFEVAEGLGPDSAIIPRVFVDGEFPWGASARVSVGRGLARSVDTALGTAIVTLADARFEPCLDAWSAGPFQARVCGIVEWAILSGEGTNTTSPQSATRSSLELGLGLRPTWTIKGRLTLGLMGGMAAPIARYRFYFAPNTTAYQLAAWAGFGEFSAGVHFW
jgi:hypothetical protein